MALMPHLGEYSRLTQKAILDDAKEFPWNKKDHEEREEAMRTNPFTALDPRIQMKHINGTPHIKVFRGVAGNHAEDIAQKAGLDDNGTVHKKVLNIASPHMSSW